MNYKRIATCSVLFKPIQIEYFVSASILQFLLTENEISFKPKQPPGVRYLNDVVNVSSLFGTRHLPSCFKNKFLIILTTM